MSMGSKGSFYVFVVASLVRTLSSYNRDKHRGLETFNLYYDKTRLVKTPLAGYLPWQDVRLLPMLDIYPPPFCGFLELTMINSNVILALCFRILVSTLSST